MMQFWVHQRKEFGRVHDLFGDMLQRMPKDCMQLSPQLLPFVHDRLIDPVAVGKSETVRMTMILCDG